MARKYNRKYNSKAKSNYTKRIARREASKVLNRQIESKIFDGQIFEAGIDYNGTNNIYSMSYDYLNAVSIKQGTDDNQYIGRKIRPVFLQIRGSLRRGDDYNVIRIAILQDKVSGTALNNAGDVWQHVGNFRAPYSPYERTYDDTFNVLYDKTFLLDPRGIGDVRTFKIKIPWRKLRMMSFKDDNGTLESGGLYMCCVSDSDPINGNPTVQCQWRLTYKDA